MDQAFRVDELADGSSFESSGSQPFHVDAPPTFVTFPQGSVGPQASNTQTRNEFCHAIQAVPTWHNQLPQPIELVPQSEDSLILPSTRGTLSDTSHDASNLQDVADVDGHKIQVTGDHVVTVVPQRPYIARHQPHTDTEYIPFTCGGIPGVRLDLVTTGRLRDLDSPTERDLFKDFRQKATYRIEWPGYRPFKYVKNVRRAGGPVTRADIVQHVLEATKMFIDEPTRCMPTNLDEHSSWRVGPGAITLGDLVLLGVEIVSTGSVQPRLGLRCPIN